MIGATTLDEYRKSIESDAALERRFQPIVVEEPTNEEALEILRGVRKNYEEHHRLVISDESLQAAVNLSARYISDRFLPDKAIDLIDETSSRVRMYKSDTAKVSKKLMTELREARPCFERSRRIEAGRRAGSAQSQDRKAAEKSDGYP